MHLFQIFSITNCKKKLFRQETRAALTLMMLLFKRTRELSLLAKGRAPETQVEIFTIFYVIDHMILIC